MIEHIYRFGGVLLWGMLLGLFYFGGLWLTVRRVDTVKHREIMMLGSFVLRNALAALGFYPAVRMGWQYALLCLAGFVAVRLALVRGIEVRPYRHSPVKPQTDNDAG